MAAVPHTRRVKTTRYFDQIVLRRRPYLRFEWIELVLRSPEHVEVQPDGRMRRWGYIRALGRYLRVVTLADGETVHNAFPDRRFLVPER
jgi:hypothetical protein